jgi:hypothetical protein
MTGERHTPQVSARRRASTDASVGWTPRRGDLAYDTARDRFGVVVTLPEDTGTCLYHLCPQGGGEEWAARIDALQAHPDTAASYRRRGDAVTADLKPLVFLYDRHATPTRVILLLRLEACRMHCEEHGWELVGEWVDDGEEALIDDRRPAFDRLVARMNWARHNVKRPLICLVHDWDRFSYDRGSRGRFIRRIDIAGGWIETIGGETSRPEERHRGPITTQPGPGADA